jgi:carbamate kinase
VPSPEPIEIVELEAIRDLVDDGALVIAAGGGGIPVVRRQGMLRGIEAVIDKDRASVLLALQLGVDVFAILTDEDFVYLDYKRPGQRPLTRVTAAEIEAHYRAGHFPPGNMGPKVESVLRFLRGGGIEAVITSYEHLRDAVAGRAGTRIVSGGAAAAELQEPCEVHVGGQ